jgi:hypothetical protein
MNNHLNDIQANRRANVCNSLARRGHTETSVPHTLPRLTGITGAPLRVRTHHGTQRDISAPNTPATVNHNDESLPQTMQPSTRVANADAQNRSEDSINIRSDGSDGVTHTPNTPAIVNHNEVPLSQTMQPFTSVANADAQNRLDGSINTGSDRSDGVTQGETEDSVHSQSEDEHVGASQSYPSAQLGRGCRIPRRRHFYVAEGASYSTAPSTDVLPSSSGRYCSRSDGHVSPEHGIENSCSLDIDGG